MIDAAALRGLTVATILPFEASGAIDWPGFDRVLDHCARPAEVAAVFVNGHAGEAASLSDEERTAVIRRARAAIGRDKPLLAGVIPHGVADAIAQARAAEKAGADCYVIFPPAALGGGAAATRAPLAYVEALTRAVDIPASIFQYPLASGFGYATSTLVEIAALDKVIAVKEGSNSMLAYEENWHALKASGHEIAVLPSNFDWFLAQLAVGADGILSGLASLVPHELAALWRASEALDLAAMRAASERLRPIVRAIYGPAPTISMHTRIKIGLRALGIIENATPRLPLIPVEPEVEATVIAAIRERRTGDGMT